MKYIVAEQTKRKPLRPRRKYSLPFFLAVVALAVLVVHGHMKGKSPATSLEESGSVAHAETVKSYHVGIQAGHWKTDELPQELNKLWWNFGASAVGVNEWEVNLDVANRVAGLLGRQGVEVDVLPATVPEGYAADAFVSIHADGNDDTSVTGYKVAASSLDTDGRAEKLAENLVTTYGKASGLVQDPNISPDMTEYYAFNRVKFLHSISRDTPGAIVELGFITNANDRSQMVNAPDRLAAGIADGILAFLKGDSEHSNR